MSAFFDGLINFLSRIKLFRTFAKKIQNFSSQQNLLEAPPLEEEIIEEPVEKPLVDSIIILPGKVIEPEVEPEEIINTNPSPEIEIAEEIVIVEKPIKKRVRKARAPKIASAKPTKKPARAAKKTTKKPVKKASKKISVPKEAQGFGF